MPLSKFQKIAKRISKQEKAMFDSLMEFEKTGKLRTKTRLNFTIDKGIAEKFRKYCRDQGYNMSAKVEDVLRKMIK
jgi:hypothetical protein